MPKTTCNCDSCVSRRAYHKNYHKTHEADVRQWHLNHRNRAKVSSKIGRFALAGKAIPASLIAEARALGIEVKVATPTPTPTPTPTKS